MDLAFALITLGALFGIGLIADEIGRRTRLPRVTLIIIFGLIAGPIGLDLVPTEFIEWYEFLASIALTMVAFLLGGSLTKKSLRAHGRQIIYISISVVAITVLIVTLGLVALGVAPNLAILLSGIATATAPAATLDTIRQSKVSNEFSETLKGIVAIDDAWGLIVFSLLMVLVGALYGLDSENTLIHGLKDLCGSILIGCLFGFPAALLTGRIRNGEPMQSEALALVFLIAGFSIWWGVSFLLAGVVAGAVVANFAKHHTRPFHEIENIEWPFLVLFFFMAGSSLIAENWEDYILIVCAFIALRILSRLLGGWLGATLSSSSPFYQRWMGAALMPQAGVAIGMAMIAKQQFPEIGSTLLTITVASTIFFEIYGPFATRSALDRSKHQLGQNYASADSKQN